MKPILLALLLSTLLSCKSDNENEDIVNTVPKTGSITTNVKVQHYNDSLDVLITEHTIYKNPTDSMVKKVIDTISSLGTTTVKDENNKDKIVKKDYNIYITVK